MKKKIVFYREEMFTVNSMIAKTTASRGWYYGDDTVKKTIQKNVNNDFPNSPRQKNNFLSPSQEEKYGTFIEKNDSVIIHKDVENASILNRRSNPYNHFLVDSDDDDEENEENEENGDGDFNFTVKKSSPTKENVDELVEKSKLMSISNTYKRPKSSLGFDIKNAIEIDDDKDIVVNGKRISSVDNYNSNNNNKSNNNNANINKQKTESTIDEEFSTVKKRPTSAQPDIEVLNSIETVYQMVIKKKK